MPEPYATFVVESSLLVPGLGLLALPSAPPPPWLATHALYTSLSVSLLVDDEQPTSLVGTIEEVAHDSQPPRRALLLDFKPNSPLHPGTHLLLTEILPSLS